MKKIHLIISGKVQGVGFRYHTKKKAQSLGVVGWVRNLPDGRVELVGCAQETAVEAFEKWCGHGPNSAEVSGVEKIEDAVSSESFQSFEILT